MPQADARKDIRVTDHRDWEHFRWVVVSNTIGSGNTGKAPVLQFKPTPTLYGFPLLARQARSGGNRVFWYPAEFFAGDGSPAEFPECQRGPCCGIRGRTLICRRTSPWAI